MKDFLELMFVALIMKFTMTQLYFILFYSSFLPSSSPSSSPPPPPLSPLLSPPPPPPPPLSPLLSYLTNRLGSQCQRVNSSKKQKLLTNPSPP